MNLEQKVFISFALFITLSIYVLILGDVGMIRSEQAKKEFSALQNKLALLKIENAYLNDQYQLMSHSPSFIMRHKNKPRNPEILILKFQDEKKDIQKEAVSYFTSSQDRLIETRILYFFVMLLFSSFGLWLVRVSTSNKAKKSSH